MPAIDVFRLNHSMAFLPVGRLIVLARAANDGFSFFAWSAFSANRLSFREPAILPLRVIRIRPSPSSRRSRDEWRRTIALARSERGGCIVCPGTPQAKFGFKSAAEQCAVTRARGQKS